MADPASKILVSDFDGTMTRRDFYQLILERLLLVVLFLAADVLLDFGDLRSADRRWPDC